MKNFWSGFEKQAGLASEVAGTVIQFPLSLVGAGVGALKGKYPKEQDKQVIEDKSWSNLLIPGVGGYRLARRLRDPGMTEGKPKKK